MRHRHDAFQSDDEDFARDLVQRVSGALANAIQFEDEHFIAERLQRALLPDRLPDVPGAEVAVRYRPSSGRGIGGDWYDVFRLPDGRVAFVVGDVTGHGIDAAVAMSTIRNALDAFGIDESDPVELVTKLNRFLCQQPGRTTATLALVVCDLHSGDLTVTTAGHLPLIVRDGSGSVTFHGARLGRPLGLSANATFRCERSRLPLDGLLVLYTDGLVERRTESITTGIDRLAAGIAAASADDGLERFADCIEAGITSVQDAEDDVALLVVRRSLAADHYENVVEARADQLSPVRSDLRRWLGQIGCGEPTASDLVLAISECAANVVEHAYPPGVHGPLEIIAGVAPADAGASEITIDIRDHGRWRVPHDVGGGRGHKLLRHLVDDATFCTGDDGTSVALRRRVELTGPAETCLPGPGATPPAPASGSGHARVSSASRDLRPCSVRASNLDTCIWLTPIRSAISDCVSSSKKRNSTIIRSRFGQRREQLVDDHPVLGEVEVLVDAAERALERRRVALSRAPHASSDALRYAPAASIACSTSSCEASSSSASSSSVGARRSCCESWFVAAGSRRWSSCVRRGTRTDQVRSRKWRLSSPSMVAAANVENSMLRSGSKRSTAFSVPRQATCIRSSNGSPRFE